MAGTESVGSPLIVIDAAYLTETLAYVRGLEQQEFRDQELAWLRANNFAAHEMLVDFFTRTIQDHSYGPEIAEPGYQGSLLGSHVLHRLAERGTLDYSDIVARWEHYKHDRRFLRYPGEIAIAERVKIFGGAAEVVETINNPIARTMFALMIRSSVAEGDSVTLPIRAQPSPRDRRQRSRINKRP